jgi:Ulp1 family protease
MDSIRKNLSQRRRLANITPEEIEKTQQSIAGPNPKIVLTNFNIDIKVEDLKRLMPGQWLNDEIINYCAQRRKKKKNDKVFSFSR